MTPIEAAVLDLLGADGLMLLVHGWLPYGKVRQVPGVAHIATVFFHLYWMPTLPLRSYVVVDGPEPAVGAVTPLGEVKRSQYWFVGIPTRLHWGSVLMAYVRAALGLGLVVFSSSAVVFGYEAVNGLGMTTRSAVVAAGVAVVSGVGFCLSRWMTRAGWASANDRREGLGLPPSDES